MPSIPEMLSEEKIVHAALAIQQCCSKESGQRLENVGKTHPVMSSGKLQMTIFPHDDVKTLSAQRYNKNTFICILIAAEDQINWQRPILISGPFSFQAHDRQELETFSGSLEFANLSVGLF